MLTDEQCEKFMQSYQDMYDMVRAIHTAGKFEAYKEVLAEKAKELDSLREALV